MVAQPNQLRAELVDDERYTTRRTAEHSIGRYIETFYNVERLHSHLDPGARPRSRDAARGRQPAWYPVGATPHQRRHTRVKLAAPANPSR
jgi:hypothetical protein